MGCTSPSGRSGRAGGPSSARGTSTSSAPSPAGWRGRSPAWAPPSPPSRPSSWRATPRRWWSPTTATKRGRTPPAAPCRCCSPRGWGCGGRASPARTIRTPCGWRPGRRRSARRSWGPRTRSPPSSTRLIPAGAARDPRAQAKAANAVGELLRPIPDAILRYSYSRLAANRLGIPVEMLARRVGGAVPRGRPGEGSRAAGGTPRRPVAGAGQPVPA